MPSDRKKKDAVNLTKPRRIKDSQRLAWCRLQPCLITKLTEGNHAHHVREFGKGGMGTKPSDFRTVPLQPWLHDLYHEIGRVAFERLYNLDFEVEITRLNSQFYKENAPKRERKKAMKIQVHIRDCEACARDHDIPLSKTGFGKNGRITSIGFMCVNKNQWVSIQ